MLRVQSEEDNISTNLFILLSAGRKKSGKTISATWAESCRIFNYKYTSPGDGRADIPALSGDGRAEIITYRLTAASKKSI